MAERTGMRIEHEARGESTAVRLEERRTVRIAAKLRRGRAHAATVTIRNISRHGFMGEGQGDPDLGEILALAVEGSGTLPLPVFISWAVAGRIGGRFSPALSQATLSLLLAAGDGA